MKKIFLSIVLVVVTLSIYSNHQVYGNESDSSEEESTWVSEAFNATSSFLNEETKDTIGISPLFEMFKNIIKAVNRVLIVLLAGISMIALSLTGIKYVMGGASPQKKEEAKKSLHTIFMGMALGFGAFFIWKIVITIINIVIESL